MLSNTACMLVHVNAVLPRSAQRLMYMFQNSSLSNKALSTGMCPWPPRLPMLSGLHGSAVGPVSGTPE